MSGLFFDTYLSLQYACLDPKENIHHKLSHQMGLQPKFALCFQSNIQFQKFHSHLVTQANEFVKRFLFLMILRQYQLSMGKGFQNFQYLIGF